MAPTPRGRAQSNVIGVVLLLGLVIAGTTGVLVLGGSALSDMEGRMTVQQAELAMTNLDRKVSNVALGTTESGRVRLGGRTAAVNGSAGTITVEQIGCSACPRSLASTDLGAVRYEQGETVVAYQGGGVWRKEGSYTRMVSPPEFHYRRGTTATGEPTLTFPLVVLRGDSSASTLAFERADSREVFPDPSAGRENPLGSGSVRITIESDYYRGWAHYFESRTDAETVTVDGANRTVSVVLSIPGKSREVTDSIASRSPTVRVQGGATVDSYNSSLGSYAATRGSAGDVYVGEDLANAGGGTVYGDMHVDGDFDGGGGTEVTGQLVVDGDVTLGGGVDVDGEIIADGDLYVSGGTQIDSPVAVSGRVVETGGGVHVTRDVVAGGDYASSSGTIDGDVYVGGDFHPAWGQNIDGNLTTGGEYRNGTISPGVAGTVTEHAPPPDLSAVEPARNLKPPNLEPIDGTISGRVSAATASNDNTGSDAARVEAGNCGGGYSSCTLTNGTYHLDSLPLNSDHLTFDTTGGPVYVAVDGDVSSTGGSTVDVVGPHEVHVYATGDYTLKSDWTSVDQRGDQVWLYGTSSSTVTITGGATVYGVVYAPGNQDIEVTGGAEVYGALVGGVSTVQGGTAVHYDTVLSDRKPRLLADSGPPVTYLHIRVNEVRVEEG
ncbi:MAG: collagen-binding domain-containing protein [Haloferacaceae archaeon]